MLFWHHLPLLPLLPLLPVLPLLSVVLADSHHQTVFTKIREKRAVFDVLPTFRPDITMELKTKACLSEVKPAEGKGRICSGRGRQVLKRTGRRKEEGGMRSKAMRNILSRMIFKQALKTKSRRQEKQYLKEDSKDRNKIPQKMTRKKVSSVKDMILGGLTVLELLLRIG